MNHMVVARDGQLDFERALVCAHVEEELFVLGGVYRVSDYARPEAFLPKETDDYERVHVPACARHYNQMSVSPWQ